MSLCSHALPEFTHGLRLAGWLCQRRHRQNGDFDVHGRSELPEPSNRPLGSARAIASQQNSHVTLSPPLRYLESLSMVPVPIGSRRRVRSRCRSLSVPHRLLCSPGGRRVATGACSWAVCASPAPTRPPPPRWSGVAEAPRFRLIAALRAPPPRVHQRRFNASGKPKTLPVAGPPPPRNQTTGG